MQAVSEAKGALCNIASIELGMKELEGPNDGKSNASIV
jgi:hypothetical protein